MTPKTDIGSSSPEVTQSSQSGQIVSIASKQHFDTFETKFFQQGDDESGGVGVEVERFDDLDDLAKHKRLAPSRQFMMGVGVGSTCIAIIGCIALWRSSGRSHVAPVAIVDPPALAEPAPSAAVAPPVQAEPAPANAAAAAPAQPSPANPSAAVVPAQPEPAVAPAPSQPAAVVAEAQPVPAPSAAVPALAQPAPGTVEKPVPAVVVPEPAKPVADEKPTAPAAAADTSEAQTRCKEAIGGRRNKDILAVCPDAFAADSSAADIAVALAKIEFDRGRTAQASEWGRKALAADPNAADAYVFIGGAEQSAGHRKAAKEAYKRYLQLAPGGRYARDLRAIVGSL
jgi:hypothetical protein